METSNNESKVLELVENFCIPVQEDILSELLSILSHAKTENDIDYAHVEHLITNDVTLSASVMQIVNSPTFKKHQKDPKDFTSLQDAIGNLGLQHLKQLLNTINLQEKYHDSSEHGLSRFWDSAVDVAVIASYLAEHLKIELSNEAYAAGLFRDCGIPVMLQGIPTYKSFLKDANQESKIDLKNLEQEAFRFDHQQVGYHLAKKWNLPDIICNVIRDYHMLSDPSSIDSHDQQEFKKNILIALVEVAEDISDKFRSMDRAQHKSKKWPAPAPFVAQYLGVTTEELHDVMEEIFENTEQLLTAHER